MTTCVVKWCKKGKEVRKAITGITFHKFPKNKLRRVEWIKAVRLERQDDDWWPTSASRVCSIHFKEEDLYLTSKGFRYLKKTAVPVCTMISPCISLHQDQPISIAPPLLITTPTENEIESNCNTNNITTSDSSVPSAPMGHTVSGFPVDQPDETATGAASENIVLPNNSLPSTSGSTGWDEFHFFAMYVADQLRSLPSLVAQDMQNKIQDLLSAAKMQFLPKDEPTSPCSCDEDIDEDEVEDGGTRQVYVYYEQPGDGEIKEERD